MIQDEVKYLGVILDKKLNFRSHINQICEKAIRCGRTLYHMLNRRSRLNVKNKALLYKMCIRPIMTYGCQIWFTKVAKSHIKKLQIIQNKNLKIIHNLPHRYSTTRLHSTYGYKMINIYMKDLMLSFKDKFRLSSFDSIRNIS